MSLTRRQLKILRIMRDEDATSYRKDIYGKSLGCHDSRQHGAQGWEMLYLEGA